MKNFKTLLFLLVSLNVFVSFGQKKVVIKGTVTDCEGIPVPRVEIRILSTMDATLTGIKGKYTIATHENDTLVFLAKGYSPQSVPVKKANTINVKLKSYTTNTDTKSVIVGKPVIYLYPTTKTDITLQLDFKGKLQTTFPKHSDKWDVTAYSDGRIFDKKTNRFYASLF